MTNDRARLARILEHVVSNAARFAAGGAITIRAWAADQRLRIAVIDRGIGMTRQQSARIFDAFQQADDSPTRRFGGMGLGLAIVRRLCERMGGSIGVESELGVGSTFTIDLPLVVAS